MEHIIAKLLQDFEQGKMSRRQLVQSLAMAATSSLVCTNPVPCSRAGKMSTIIAISAASKAVKNCSKKVFVRLNICGW